MSVKHDALTSSAQDSGLSCPQCDYNLTGLPEHVCPECGAAFDPEELRRRPMPIPGWERPELAAFVRVCLMTWFRPGTFACRFPLRYDPTAAASFRRYALIVSIVLIAASTAVLPHLTPTPTPRGAIMIVFFGTVVMTGTLSVATLLVECQIRLVLDENYGRSSFNPAVPGTTSWKGPVGFYRSFLILLTPVVIWSLFLGRILAPYGLLASLVIFLWWCWSLGRSILVQGRGPGLFVYVIVLLPSSVAVGCIVGIFTGWILASLIGVFV